MNKAMMGPARTVYYQTPAYLLKWMDDRFGPFTYDPCPMHDAAIWDATQGSWSGIVYCNPPYGRVIPQWLMKRFEPDRTVYLLPARTDTAWWHHLVIGQAREIWWLEGRVRFAGMEHPAPFPSVVLVYEKRPFVSEHWSIAVTELQRRYGWTQET